MANEKRLIDANALLEKHVCYVHGEFYELGINFITHWMPLPQPPKG